jgi:hypothetical protein
MTILLAKPGIALSAGGGKRLLWAPLRTSTPGSTSAAAILGISGISAYWDASVLSNMLASSGSAVVGWNVPVAGIADSSGNSQPLSAYSYASGATLPNATARLNGLLGGAGLSTVSAAAAAAMSPAPYLPYMGADQGWRAAGVTLGAAANWTVYLVWSRPNQRLGSSTAPITLVSAGSTPLVTISSTAPGPNTLSVGGTAISTAIERRHTHSLILSYAHAAGAMTVYLDGATTGTTLAVSVGSGGALTLLHDTTAGGGAQCWFHEAAYWNRALSGSDITTLETNASRWQRGARRGISILVCGQSNAINAWNAGAWHQMAQGVAWYLGALGWNALGSTSLTMMGGQGIYVSTADAAAGYSGSMLTDPNDGSNPSTWALGPNGVLAEDYVLGLSAADMADVAAVWWPWSESDSGKTVSEQSQYVAACQRYIGLIRGWLGKTAAQCPLLTWNAMPFGWCTNGGNQMIRQAEHDLTQVSGLNAVIALPNTAGMLPLNCSNYSTTTGGVTSGTTYSGTNVDFDHADNNSLLSWGVMAVPGAASAILASSGGDTISVIPSGVTRLGGPQITHVYQQAPTQYKLTIQPDAGTGLATPLMASTGDGFGLMDGGTLASPGNIILATSCAVVDSTHLLLTVASTPVNPAASLTLYYPYGNTGGSTPMGEIGLGNLVTDNASSIAVSGWDIGNQLGSQFAINYPLAATTYGLPVSTTPT